MQILLVSAASSLCNLQFVVTFNFMVRGSPPVLIFYAGTACSGAGSAASLLSAVQSEPAQRAPKAAAPVQRRPAPEAGPSRVPGAGGSGRRTGGSNSTAAGSKVPKWLKVGK